METQCKYNNSNSAASAVRSNPTYWGFQLELGPEVNDNNDDHRISND